MTAQFEVQDLSVELDGPAGTVCVVDSISYSVDSGKVLGMVGESGSGKTLSVLGVLGLLPGGARARGSARLNGRDLMALKPRERRQVLGKDISVVLQDPYTSLHPMLTIGRQMTDHVRQHLRVGKSEASDIAVRLLHEVRIPDAHTALGRYPHEFSGGMRQRIAIAMALACGPQLIITDEPTTALDPTVQADVLRTLRELQLAEGLGWIIISHDLGVVSALADEVVVLYSGRIVEAGTASELLTRPRHPYTRALLDSLPDAGHKELVTLRGVVPSPANRPPGCAFHPRCRFSTQECAEKVPVLRELADRRLLACPVDPLRKG